MGPPSKTKEKLAGNNELKSSPPAKLCCDITIINQENNLEYFDETYTSIKNKINSIIAKYDDICVKYECENNSEKIYRYLEEKFNAKKVYQFLLSGIADEEYYTSVQKYVSISRQYVSQEKEADVLGAGLEICNDACEKDIHSVNVRYCYPKNGIGRFKVRCIAGGGDGREMNVKNQTGMWNVLKSYCLKDIAIDCDIANAHHSILEQIMKWNNIDATYISKYNANRDYYFDLIMKTFNTDRRGAKEIVLQYTYGASIHNKYFSMLPEDVKRFVHEINIAMRVLLERYPQYIEESKSRRKEKINANDNINGSAFSLMLQTYERRVIECVHKFFEINGYNVFAIIMDGIHICNKKEVSQDILNKCSDYIKEKLLLDIKVTIKEFKNINLNDFPLEKKFDPLFVEEIDEDRLHFFNSERICQSDDNPFSNVNILRNNGKSLREIILLKSSTGSGKTYYMKKLIEYLKKNSHDIIKLHEKKNKRNEKKVKHKSYFDEDLGYVLRDEKNEETVTSHNIGVISLVSRVTLSNTHEIEFGLKNYGKTKEHSLDEVFQLDSIGKVVYNTGEYYVVILDEVSSLCSHFNNGMEHMTSKRIEMVQKFRDIINNPKCICVFAADDNLNTGTIKFFKRLTERRIDIFINQFVNKFEEKVRMCTDIDYVINNMKKNIDAGEFFVSCSNTCSNFFRSVVIPLIHEKKLTRDQYLVYSGNFGEKLNGEIKKKMENEEEETDKDLLDAGIHIQKGGAITDDWKNKYIFFTPSILYGLSFNQPASHHVYGFYFKNSPLHAMDCNQQLNRVRKTRDGFTIYAEMQMGNPVKSFEEQKKENFYGEYSRILNEKVNDYDNRLALVDLLTFDRFVKSNYSDLFYYIPFLLGKKGYTNVEVILDETEKQTKYKKKEFNKMMIEEYNNGTLDEKKKDNVDIYMRSFGFNSKIIDSDPELKQIEREIRDKCMDIFIDDNNVRCLNLYKNLMDRTFEDRLKNDNDIVENKASSDNYKIKILDDLHKILGIEWFDRKLIEKLKEMDPIDMEKKIILPEYIKNALKSRTIFRYEGKDIPTIFIELVQLLLSKYNMFSDSVISHSKKTNFEYKIDGRKRKKIPTVAVFVDKLDAILGYSEKIKELKDKKRDDNKEEFKEYAF